MSDADSINIIEKALRKWNIVYCIKDICLSDSVVTDNTVDPGRKFHFSLTIILKVRKCQILEVHDFSLIRGPASGKITVNSSES